MKRTIALLMSALALAAVAGGLWVAGGPEYARKTERDRDRYNDLANLAVTTSCGRDSAPDSLPREDAETCDVRVVDPSRPNRIRGRTDPLTGEAYRFEKIDQTSFRVCADFETDYKPYSYGDYREDFDPETGCITANVTRP
jgi:hypothetical protein